MHKQNYTLRNGKVLKSHVVGLSNQCECLQLEGQIITHVLLTSRSCGQWQALLMHLSTLSVEPELSLGTLLCSLL